MKLPVSVVLRVILAAVVVAGVAGVFRQNGLVHSRPVVAAESLQAPVRQVNPGALDLGKGFSAVSDGSATVITTPCKDGYLLDEQASFAPWVFSTTKNLGTLNGSTLRLEPPSSFLTSVHLFGCSTLSEGGLAPSRQATTCLALVQQTAPVEPKSIACPISTWKSGERMFRPEMQLATVTGKIDVVDGLGGTLGLDGCDFGNKVQLSLDGKSLATHPLAASLNADTKIVLPRLENGVHKVESNCVYDDPSKPTVAERGACISIMVEAATISKLENCSQSIIVSALDDYYFDLDDNGTTLAGACGGYGFSASTTTAKGIATSLVAVVAPNKGDRVSIAPPKVDPVGFFVAACWSDIAATKLTQLRCYHVAEFTDDSGQRLGLAPTNAKASCPFTTIRSVDTF